VAGLFTNGKERALSARRLGQEGKLLVSHKRGRVTKKKKKKVAFPILTSGNPGSF